LDQNLNSKTITGSKISKNLKEDIKFKKIPIIILTADTFREDVENILKESKAEACLEKPIDFDKINKVIRELLT
jgi:CheY-like chemotaxis protein